MHTVPAPWLSYVIPIVVIAVVMALRWRQMSKPRQLKIETLWILPAVYCAIVALIFYSSPPAPAGWGWSALALAIGAGIGWYRGRMMRITVDPETHTLSQQASPAAFLLLIVLVVFRSAARQEVGGGNPTSPAALLATDVAMAFALGLVASTRVEMALRAKRLLRESLSRTFR
jgi:NAD/NADP transhydrogenase beta subunit